MDVADMKVTGFYYKSCPVCGSDHLYLVQDFNGMAIVCKNCGASTGFHMTFQECEDIWLGKGAKYFLPVYDGT